MNLSNLQNFGSKLQNPSMITSKQELKMLSLFVDEKGVIRVGGQVMESVTYYEMKHPILLLNKRHISYLKTRKAHQMGHTGMTTTAAKTWQRYWIMKVHDLAKSIEYKCVSCHEMQAKLESQMMANLPKIRLMPHTPAFYHTVCDYFGPHKVKIGWNKTTKCYRIIFMCLNTQAVHLELATDCLMIEFIQALRRSFAIRGYPVLMLNDNGTQLVGAANELHEMIHCRNKKKLQEYAAHRGMEWKFITPTTPHQNGCAKSLVKSCKIALEHAIGDHLTLSRSIQLEEYPTIWMMVPIFAQTIFYWE